MTALVVPNTIPWDHALDLDCNTNWIFRGGRGLFSPSATYEIEV